MILAPSNQIARIILQGQSEPAHKKFANVTVYNRHVSFLAKVSRLRNSVEECDNVLST